MIDARVQKSKHTLTLSIHLHSNPINRFSFLYTRLYPTLIQHTTAYKYNTSTTLRIKKTSIKTRLSLRETENHMTYYHRRQHKGLSAFVRALVGVILLLTNSRIGVDIVAAVEKVDRGHSGDPLSSSTTLLVEDEEDTKEDSAIDTDSNIGISSISHHMKTISRSLRGNDHIATLAAADQGLDNQLGIVQSLMKLQKEGNIKDKASTIRSLMGGLKDFGMV